MLDPEITNRKFILILKDYLTSIRDEINKKDKVNELEKVAQDVKEGKIKLEPINIYTYEMNPLLSQNLYETYMQIFILYSDIYDIYQEKLQKGKAVKWLDEKYKPIKEENWKTKLKEVTRAIILGGLGSGLVVCIETLIKFILGHPSNTERNDLP